MQIKREALLNRLVKAENHHLVKIITGIRRCGKSYLLFTLFKDHLLRSGVPQKRILEVNLEIDEFKHLRNAVALSAYLHQRIDKRGKRTYVLIDEIQLVQKTLPEGIDLSQIHPADRESAYVTFLDVLNGLLDTPNVVIYVTGSNSKMLSSDIATEFRGRGEVIHVTPLSFNEFLSAKNSFPDRAAALENYLLFGGLPECVLMSTAEEKRSYLEYLYSTIYLKDIADRHKLPSDTILKALTDVVMSNIGGITNPQKLANSVQTVMRTPCSRPTIASYLDYLEEAFLIAKARKYDVKGKRYFESPMKCYATDLGIRNIHIGNRQMEMPHLVENALYNELVRCGYTVDVGEVSTSCRKDGKIVRKTCEIDFVVNRGYERIYIQSAWMIPDAEKMAQETFSLKHTGDNFRKVVIDGSPMVIKHLDNDGIGHIGLLEFLTDPKSIETL